MWLTSVRTRLLALDRNRLQRLTTEGSWIIVGQIATVLGSLVLVRVLTEYLEPAQYGQLALGLTIAGLVNQTVMAGVAPGIGRFYSIAAEKHDLPGYLKASQRLMGYATLGVCAIALLLIAGLFWSDNRDWIALSMVVLVFSIVGGYNAALNGVQNAARQRAIVAMHNGIGAWLKIGLAVAVILWLGSSSTAVVIGYVLSMLLVTLSQLYFLKRLIDRRSAQTEPATQENWARQIWFYSWPLMAGGLPNWAYFASQRWALELFVATEEVGKFYALTQIAYTPLNLAGAMLMSFLMPILFARAGDSNNFERVRNVYQMIRQIAIGGFCATLVAAGAAYFYHELIFSIFVSPIYRDVSIYMPLIVLAAGFLAVSQQIGMVVLVKNETRRFLTQSVVGNSLTALLNLGFTRMWGVEGLVASMVLGSLIHLTWTIFIVVDVVRIRSREMPNAYL